MRQFKELPARDIIYPQNPTSKDLKYCFNITLNPVFKPHNPLYSFKLNSFLFYWLNLNVLSVCFVFTCPERCGVLLSEQARWDFTLIWRQSLPGDWHSWGNKQTPLNTVDHEGQSPLPVQCQNIWGWWWNNSCYHFSSGPG